jgi:acyl-CoA thioester hydrolase
LEAIIHKKFTTKIRVYWSDCDSAHIAFYGNFFRFFEMAEEDLYQSQGRSRSSIYLDLQVGFPRVETHCRFHKPARLGDLLEVTVWISQRSSRSMEFQFEVRRDGETDLVAVASYSIVCINRQFKPVPFPEELLQVLGPYLPPVSNRKAKETVSVSENG